MMISGRPRESERSGDETAANAFHLDLVAVAFNLRTAAAALA